MQVKSALLLITTALLSSQVLATSYTDPVDGKLDMGEYLAENAYGFLPVPIVITEPAVGYGGGIMGVFLHESKSQKEKRKKLALESIDGGAQLLTPAITVAGAYGTENGSWGSFLGHRHTWKKDSIRYLGGAFYGDMNMDFYPPFANNDASFELNMKGKGIIQKVKFRLGDSSFFIGASQKYIDAELAINDNDKLENIANKAFDMSPKVSGLGGLIEYDSRNNFLYPTKGGDYSAEYMVFSSALGSEYDFKTTNIKGTQYVPINDKWNVAFQGKYNYLSTEELLLPPPAYPFT